MEPINDQGFCSSSWAFATQNSMSSNACIMYDLPLEQYSSQYLVDCVTTNYGCNGGNVSNAATYLKTHYEILGSDYPYKGDFGVCDYAT